MHNHLSRKLALLFSADDQINALVRQQEQLTTQMRMLLTQGDVAIVQSADDVLRAAACLPDVDDLLAHCTGSAFWRIFDAIFID